MKKNVLLLGRMSINIPNFETGVIAQNINLFSGTNLEEVKNVFNQNNNQIEMVIMGAGIDLDSRLKIIEHIFTVSKSSTVHMKDWNSGPAGMLPFVNGILKGIIE